MKKITCIALAIILMMSGCSNKKEIEELENKISSLEATISSKDHTITQLQTSLDSIKNELSLYTYTPDTPSKISEPLEDPSMIEDLLTSSGSKITGTVTDANSYGNGTLSFYVTTEKGGKYYGVMIMNDELTEVISITIYISSEFCYCWGYGSILSGSEKAWYLDKL